MRRDVRREEGGWVGGGVSERREGREGGEMARHTNHSAMGEVGHATTQQWHTCTICIPSCWKVACRHAHSQLRGL